MAHSTVGTVKLDDGESTPFPRGGQESLTPLEKRVIHQQVKQDVLFNEVCCGSYRIVVSNYSAAE